MANTGMLVSMKPTSIAYSGTSASVNNNGGVDFTAVTEITINGVFATGIDNYLIVLSNCTGSIDNKSVTIRLTSLGSLDTDGSWNRQLIQANSTTITANRATAVNTGNFGNVSTSISSGFMCHIYGPYLEQPTALRVTSIARNPDVLTVDFACTQTESSAFDGFRLAVSLGDTFTGNVHVFGYRE
jgi:hypothetical protein